VRGSVNIDDMKINKHTQLLIDIYKAADFLGSTARMNSNDLTAPDWSRRKNGGFADACDYIKRMILDFDRLGSVDYYAVNKIKKDLPAVLCENLPEQISPHIISVVINGKTYTLTAQ
jgi:hypothetical protein